MEALSGEGEEPEKTERKQVIRLCNVIKRKNIKYTAVLSRNAVYSFKSKMVVATGRSHNNTNQFIEYNSKV